MITLKDVRASMRRKWRDEERDNPDSAKPMAWNIYAPGQEHRKYTRKFNIIRILLKGWFLMPGLWLMKKLFRKVLEKNVERTPYNINLKIFNDAFDESIEVWLKEFIARHNCKDYFESINIGHDGGFHDFNQELYDRWKNGHAVEALMLAKQLTLTLALNDTAYREFVNVLVFTIANKVIEEYKGCTEIKQLMFKEGTPYHVQYLVASQIVQMERSGSMAELLNRSKELRIGGKENDNKI